MQLNEGEVRLTIKVSELDLAYLKKRKRVIGTTFSETLLEGLECIRQQDSRAHTFGFLTLKQRFGQKQETLYKGLMSSQTSG